MNAEEILHRGGRKFYAWPDSALQSGGPQPTYATYIGHEEARFVPNKILHGLRALVQPGNGITVRAQFLDEGTGMAVGWYEFPEADFDLDVPFEWDEL